MIAVTLSARDIVAQCMACQPSEPSPITGLRARVQSVMGYLAVWSLDEGRFNRVRLIGNNICTDALADLPGEQSKLFLPLSAISHSLEAFDGNALDLRAIFDRVFNTTARFDGDDEEGMV